jgi:hypothetical protein
MRAGTLSGTARINPSSVSARGRQVEAHQLQRAFEQGADRTAARGGIEAVQLGGGAFEVATGHGAGDQHLPRARLGGAEPQRLGGGVARAGRVPGRETRHGQARQQTRILRREAHGGFKGGDGLARAAGARLDAAQHVEQLRIGGAGHRGARQGGGGVVVLPGFDLDGCQQLRAARILRKARHVPARRVLRLRGLTQGALGGGEQQQPAREAGHLARNALELRIDVGPVAGGGELQGAQVDGHRAGRSDGQRRVDVGAGAIRLAGAQQHLGAAQARAQVARRTCDDARQALDPAADVAAFELEAALAQQDVRVVGAGLQQPVEPRLGAGTIAARAGDRRGGQVRFGGVRREGERLLRRGGRSVLLPCRQQRQGTGGEDLRGHGRVGVRVGNREILEDLADPAAHDIGAQQQRGSGGRIETALQGGARLALGRLAVAHLQAEAGERGAKGSIGRRRTDRVAHLDLCGPEVAARLRRLGAPLGRLGGRRHRLPLCQGRYRKGKGGGECEEMQLRSACHVGSLIAGSEPVRGGVMPCVSSKSYNVGRLMFNSRAAAERLPWQ